MNSRLRRGLPWIQQGRALKMEPPAELQFVELYIGKVASVPNRHEKAET